MPYTEAHEVEYREMIFLVEANDCMSFCMWVTIICHFSTAHVMKWNLQTPLAFKAIQ